MTTGWGDPFIAVDWGTTNRRAFRVEGGQVAAAERDARGVAALAPDDYPAEVAGIRHRLGDLPLLLVGMVGSSIGWRTVPYVAAPAGLAQLAAGLAWVDGRTAIVPGVAAPAGAEPDVMRGEEVQLLGAVAAGLAPPDALVAQPGTHCKWATLRGGRIAGFTTAMTGELFALLRDRSILAGQLGAPVAVGPAFSDGVARGASGDLAAALFGVRAAGLLGRRDAADAAAYASGLLIGDDVANRLRGLADPVVHLVADPALGALYAAAIDALGGTAVPIDSDRAFVAGAVHLARLIA